MTCVHPDLTTTETPKDEVNPPAQTSTSLPEEWMELLHQPEKAEYLSFQAGEHQLRVGYVPGVMPGKWFGRWHERYDVDCPLVEIPLAEGRALDSLQSDAQDPLTHMVLLRPEDEPLSTDKIRFHSINLYREKQVVIFPREHVLEVFDDEVPLAELRKEFLLQDPETVPEWAEISAPYRASNPQKLPQMRHLQDAVELVAAGLGLLIVPMSIARLYHRKDLTYRVVSGLSESAVNLVWERKDRSEQAENIIQDFVGICRGRTAGSDRGTESLQIRREKAAREKEEAKQKKRAANARRETRDRKARNAKKNGNARQHQAQKKQAQPRQSGGRNTGGRK